MGNGLLGDHGVHIDGRDVVHTTGGLRLVDQDDFVDHSISRRTDCCAALSFTKLLAKVKCERLLRDSKPR